ncbi:TPA: hypothetical protein SE777_001768 [Campylobacter jejuni]|uniref:hypothetical protein n=1 Tax=Campylobacter jejuni TaxID=197 RepID=UPI0011AA141B|nr:hypothetical protein [Campylobacter jejuni]ECP8882247.1 hypothetical protein [Campylobacter jejuni]HEA7304254.1 hypothetical protein [Campylobacter jejuni]HEG6727712.1 hypothetical protein [Campylobacter jejuni]HEH5457157.1 hypothetical protein [Campylobacter jejuni]HEH5469038.1 hypothetical protein [Campylobacter jejuni]
MDKAHLITYLVSLAFIVSGLIVCCILYLFKDKINKITPENIDNINSNVKDFIEKNIGILNSNESTIDYITDPTYSYMPENIYHNNQD